MSKRKERIIVITNERPRWIWYAGDFEIRQGLLQNFSREERG